MSDNYFCKRILELELELEKALASKDSMIASLLIERKYVKDHCCDGCLMLFDGPQDDAEVLIKEWLEGKR